MSGFRDWSVWQWDWQTAWVALWMLQFAAIEWLGAPTNQMVTDHWRPAIHSSPVTWWIALGVWLWLGPHFLFPGFERWLARIVGGG